jgi:glycosyltransferase involved in cell wall biosynthesis
MKKVVSLWGVPTERIVRIYSVLKEISTDTDVRAQFNPLSDTFVITTSARLVPWKGIDTLISVVASLKRDGLKVSLHIFGDGVKRRELEELSEKEEMTDSVTFHGAVTREVLGSALQASHAFVLNTSYEGLSHQLLEVMSLGVPIITTSVGGNVELIQHEKTGLLIPYNHVEKLKEALIRLRQDPGLRNALTLNAVSSLSRFSEKTIVDELRVFFQSVRVPLDVKTLKILK